MRRFAISLTIFSAALLASCSTKGTNATAEQAAEEAKPERELIHPNFDWTPYQKIPAVRGVWLTNVDSDVLMSRENIVDALDALKEANFNVVYPVVWNKGMTLYRSEVIQRYLGENQPAETAYGDEDGERIRTAHRTGIDPVYGDRDPLQELIEEAHVRGIEVIPWFEFGFASSYNTGGGPILEMYPQWAAIGPDGELVKKNNFEWMNAFDPEVQQFLTDLIMEVVNNYDVDGIQGDDRLPALPTLGGYDEATKARYRAEFGQDPPEDIKDPQWVQWRADILTGFLKDLREEVKSVDPNLTVSMSPSYWDWALYEYLQDSKTWTDRGLVDTVHPQAYRYDFDRYASVIDDLVANQFLGRQRDLLYPGILIKLGNYRIDNDFFLDTLAYNRMNDVNGEVYFFYPGLRENNDELLRLVKETAYTEPVELPYRYAEPNPWRPEPVIVPVEEMRLEGDWQAMAGSPQYRVNPGGASSRLILEAEVPVQGVYDVYMKMPAGTETMTQAAFFVLPQIQVDLSLPKDQRPEIPIAMNRAGEALKVATIDQSATPTESWVKLGSTPLQPEQRFSALSLLTNEPTEQRQTVAGPVALVLNRLETRRYNEN